MNETFKVMTFNLRISSESDPFLWDERKHWAVELMKKYNSDLLGTQEARPHMLEWLKERLSSQYEVYGINRLNSQVVGEYSAIFIKKDSFVIGRKGSFMLSETPAVIGSKGWDGECERICSWVELAACYEANRPILRFYNTHLDHVGKVAREEGLKLIMQQMQEENRRAKLPTILTGDFNDTPESGLLHIIDDFVPMASCFDRWTAEKMQHASTFHNYLGGTEGSPIDYILYSEGFELISTVIVRDQTGHGYPSDHYPVLAEMRLTSNS